MDRRELLLHATRGAALLLWRNEEPDRAAELLKETLAAARLTGKPVLAIVVPAKDWERSERSSLWGSLFNDALDALLVRLALVEVVCVPARVLTPFVAKDGDAAFAYLIAQQSGAPPTPIRAELPPMRAGSDATDSHARRVEALGLEVCWAISPDLPSASRLALANRIALDAPTLRDVERDLAELTRPPLARLERGAALYYFAALGRTGPANAWLGDLAELAIDRLRRNPPRGAHWNPRQPIGCTLGPCGTGGAILRTSRQFLSFWTLAR